MLNYDRFVKFVYLASSFLKLNTAHYLVAESIHQNIDPIRSFLRTECGISDLVEYFPLLFRK